MYIYILFMWNLNLRSISTVCVYSFIHMCNLMMGFVAENIAENNRIHMSFLTGFIII